MKTAVRWYGRVVARAPMADGSQAGLKRPLLGLRAGSGDAVLPAAVSAILRGEDSAAFTNGVPFGFRVKPAMGPPGMDALEVASEAPRESLARHEGVTRPSQSAIASRVASSWSSDAGVSVLVPISATLDKRVSAPALAVVTSLSGPARRSGQQSAPGVPSADAFGRTDWTRKAGKAAWALQAQQGKSSALTMSQRMVRREAGAMGLRALTGAVDEVSGGPSQDVSHVPFGNALSALGVADVEQSVPPGRGSKLNGLRPSGAAAVSQLGFNDAAQFQSMMLEVVPRAPAAAARGAGAAASMTSSGRLPESQRAVDNGPGQARTADRPSSFDANQADTGSVVALRGNVLMDGRRMGRLVASGQASAASLPQVSASSVNLRATPVFSGTSIAL